MKSFIDEQFNLGGGCMKNINIKPSQLMDFSELLTIRLKNQQLTSSHYKTPQQLVEWMGAIQAQDYNSAKWAIGIRLPHLTEEQVESSFNQGEILRTHVMRPTWHFVSKDDIYWMLKLSSPQIKAVLNSRHRELGITEFLVNKCYLIMEEAIHSNELQAMTREELISEFERAGLPTDLQLASHFFLSAEIDGIICSGPLKGKKHTYSLLSKRVPNKILLTKEEALAKLALKYFSSHGPATVADFIWWSGLSASNARSALESIKDNLVSIRIASDNYWLSATTGKVEKPKDSVYLLPAYDEFLISYKDRSASITADDHKKAISSNGIFRPVVLVNGQINGLWKRDIKKDEIIIRTEYFRPHDKTDEVLIASAAEMLGSFIGKRARIKVG